MRPLSPERTRIFMIAAGTRFPDGHGATARVREYVRGFRDAGADVRVLLLASLRPDDWPDTGAPAVGAWLDIPYEYMSGVAHGEKGWMRRRVSELRAIRRTCAQILAARRSSGRAAAVIMAENVRWVLPVTLACRIAGVTSVHSRSEFPFVYERHQGAGLLHRLWQRAYVASVFRLFDGVIAISTCLETYISARVRKDAWVIRVPILVDAPTFDCGGRARPGLVGYAGVLGHSEELLDLIEAAALVRAEHPEVGVRIVGGGSDEAVDLVRAQADRHGMTEALELTGFAGADEMPGLLCECAALALPRAAGMFSTAGMPTKLGEYLATGRPVVVTETGDIPLYLHDGVEAYLTAPRDVEAFAQALATALFDPSAADVGRAGQRLAREEFSPEVHMRRVLDAIESGSVPRP